MVVQACINPATIIHGTYLYCFILYKYYKNTFGLLWNSTFVLLMVCEHIPQSLALRSELYLGIHIARTLWNICMSRNIFDSLWKLLQLCMPGYAGGKMLHVACKLSNFSAGLYFVF